MALIHALRTWRCYLYDSVINVLTDNVSLKWIQTKKDLNGRQARWIATLQEYPDLKIRHIPGITNTAADALSRPADESVRFSFSNPLQHLNLFLPVPIFECVTALPRHSNVTTSERFVNSIDRYNSISSPHHVRSSSPHTTCFTLNLRLIGRPITRMTMIWLQFI